MENGRGYEVINFLREKNFHSQKIYSFLVDFFPLPRSDKITHVTINLKVLDIHFLF